LRFALAAVKAERDGRKVPAMYARGGFGFVPGVVFLALDEF
jgi:hypothetical protein